MNRRRSVKRAATLLLVLAVLVLAVGHFLGQPILLSYVTSESMQPALDAGDGFIAVPPAVAGPIDEGDVVTYRAKTVDGGGLSTHRVVSETERGYVTKGDNNPFTDQDGGEPPVKETQIVAVAYQPGGSMVTIPYLGTVFTGIQGALSTVQRHAATVFGVPAIAGPQGLAYLLVAFSIVAYVADVLWSSKRDPRDRDRDRDTGTNTRALVALMAAALVVAATAAMVLPAGAQEFAFVSAESDNPSTRVIEAGTTESRTDVVGNSGFIPVISHFEPGRDDIEIQPRETAISGRATVNTTVTLSAPPETGHYRRHVTEHRYLHVLPQSTIRSLYAIHAWLPIVAIDLMLGLPVYAIGVAIAGGSRLRPRSRDRDLSPVRRLRRRLRDRD